MRIHYDFSSQFDWIYSWSLLKQSHRGPPRICVELSASYKRTSGSILSPVSGTIEPMNEHEAKIAELEAEMQKVDFWSDKVRAQAVIKEIQELKDKALGGGEYDAKPAVFTIFSGAGGDDAEDFTSMLFEMYRKLAERRGWKVFLIHEHKNDHGGYRNITFEISEKGAYGMLKNESGVHRLVRVSPFSSKKLRHTSFSLVEVIPKFDETEKIDIPEADLAPAPA